MKNAQTTDRQLTHLQRLIHLVKAIGLALTMILLVLYGLTLTTNIMTQINHSSTWFYISVLIICYFIIGLGFAGLYVVMSRNIKKAVARIK